MKRKQITFMCNREDLDLFGIEPIPAITAVPDWYKKIPKYSHGAKTFRGRDGYSNQTVKTCVPFLEALTVGYLIVTQSDIVVDLENDTPLMSWKSEAKMVDMHSRDQFENFDIPEEFYPTPLKFINDYIIKTPKGYSTLFTHPLNHFNTPFYVLSGLVETDKLNVSVNLPFFIKKGFSGVIEAGTPIAQIVPIKREGWNMKKLKFDIKFLRESYGLFNQKYLNFYRKQIWVKKDYK